MTSAWLSHNIRNIIIENADHGTKAGFVAILKSLVNTDLISFDWVKRAVGEYLRMDIEKNSDLERVSDNSISLIINCFENERLREEYLKSEDDMAVYVAVWSYGYDNIDDFYEKIDDIARNGSTHQLRVLKKIVSDLDSSDYARKIAKIVSENHPDNAEVWRIVDSELI